MEIKVKFDAIMYMYTVGTSLEIMHVLFEPT